MTIQEILAIINTPGFFKNGSKKKLQALLKKLNPCSSVKSVSKTL
jgi:hypothetical protein